MTSQLQTSQMPWERRGTISLEQGSQTVLGVGTVFTFSVAARDALYVDGVPYPIEIEEVVSATELKLSTPWTDASMTDVAYVVIRGYSWNLAANIAARQGRLLEKWQTLQSVYVGETPPADGYEGDVNFNLADPENMTIARFSQGEWAAPASFNGPTGRGWLVGEGPPDDAQGIDGQPYADVLNGVIYGEKVNGSWPMGVSIHVGSGPPPPNLGRDGEVYFDLPLNKTVYGPKQNGQWGAEIDLTGKEGLQGDNGAGFVINEQGLAVDLSNYDNEAKGFVFYATDTSSAYQRSSDTPGLWKGPIAFGVQEQVFYGFYMNDDGDLLVDTGEGDFNVDDYATWIICAGPCAFEIDNGVLTQTF